MLSCLVCEECSTDKKYWIPSENRTKWVKNALCSSYSSSGSLTGLGTDKLCMQQKLWIIRTPAKCVCVCFVPSFMTRSFFSLSFLNQALVFLQSTNRFFSSSFLEIAYETKWPRHFWVMTLAGTCDRSSAQISVIHSRPARITKYPGRKRARFNQGDLFLGLAYYLCYQLTVK